MIKDGWLARSNFLWQDYWSRRSRLRAVSAVGCLVLALLGGVLSLTPDAWIRAVQSALTAVTRSVSALDPRLVEIILCGVLVVAMLALVASPIAPRRYRRNAMFSGRAPARPGASARTVVYLDAENQPAYDFENEFQRANSEITLKLLIQRLREHLNGTRADLLFYMDGLIPEYTRRRRELYRFGFRLVDVPHNPFETGGSKKGMVDMELAMQAIGRALDVSQPQHIILIAADQDYIPLIYHLWYEGHTIEVWGDFVPEAFFRLQDYLSMTAPGYVSPAPVAGRVKVIEYDPQSPGANPAVAEAIAADVHLAGDGLSKLTTWIEQTISALDAVKADTKIPFRQKYQALRGQLESKIPWLQMEGGSASDDSLLDYWLLHLLTLRALDWKGQSDGGSAPITDVTQIKSWGLQDIPRYAHGERPISAAAKLSGRLLVRVATIARAMGDQKVKPDVALDRLCDVVLRGPNLTGMASVMRALSPRSECRLPCAQVLCQCARELGLLTFDQHALLKEKRLLPPPAGQQ